MVHFKKAIEELEASLESKREKAHKYKHMNDDPKRSIKAIKKIIKNNNAKIEELQKEVDTFENKKKLKAVEQQAARREIDKKLVKKTYKLLEKDSDKTIIRLMETFVAMLRNKPSASREDVELYMRKHDGLDKAMEKVNPRHISGANAQKYTEVVQAIRNQFTSDGPYNKYIPYLVFLNQTCAMVNLTIEEKQYEYKIEDLRVENKKKEQEIDEIETFHQHVDEVVDYEVLVEQEEKQLILFKNHYELLTLRLAKLQRYSAIYEKYYFYEIKKPNKLASNTLMKVDTMDDFDKLKEIEKYTSLNLAQTATKRKKENYEPYQHSVDESKESEEESKGEAVGRDVFGSRDSDESEGSEESGDDEGASEDNSDEEESGPVSDEEDSR